MTSTFTGASVSRIDIEPVAIEALACASSVGLRPSQPTGASPAWPMPDQRLRLARRELAGIVAAASRRSRPSRAPGSGSSRRPSCRRRRAAARRTAPGRARRAAAFSTGRGGGRRYSCRSVARSSGERACAATPAVVPTTPATAKPSAAACRRPEMAQRHRPKGLRRARTIAWQPPPKVAPEP